MRRVVGSETCFCGHVLNQSDYNVKKHVIRHQHCLLFKLVSTCRKECYSKAQLLCSMEQCRECCNILFQDHMLVVPEQ